VNKLDSKRFMIIALIAIMGVVFVGLVAWRSPTDLADIAQRVFGWISTSGIAYILGDSYRPHKE